MGSTMTLKVTLQWETLAYLSAYSGVPCHEPVAAGYSLAAGPRCQPCPPVREEPSICSQPLTIDGLFWLSLTLGVAELTGLGSELATATAVTLWPTHPPQLNKVFCVCQHGQGEARAQGQARVPRPLPGLTSVSPCLCQVGDMK